MLHQSIWGDRVGDTLRQARAINIRTIATTVRDHIGGGDRFDVYRFRLGSRSQLVLSLTGLRGNADLALLNHRGRTIKRSVRLGSTSETIQQPLEADTYYIRVSGGARRTHYRLTTRVGVVPSAIAELINPIPPNDPISSEPVVPTLPPTLPTPVLPTPPPVRSFDIQFDTRFDTNGWFTPERRNVLEAAATLWENIIQDEFEPVSIGTHLHVIDPQTGNTIRFNADYEIDDLVVFVGARPFDGAGGDLANGGPSGFWTVGSRLETRYQGASFEPWTASLGFDVAENWFFDPTPETATDIPANQPDFFSIVLHELGHALGIGTSKAFDDLVHNNAFTGTQAIAQHSGSSIPLTFDGHVQDGFIANSGETEALMDPSLRIGTRKRPTRLDMAFLEDIGYSVVAG